jgi:glycosyltransferase involved in cell wall biosynthesis
MILVAMAKNCFWVYTMRCKLKVTIGLCVKNSAKTIKETIQSILDQDFPSDLMELIIVDGYSADDTLEIIENCLLKVNVRYKIFRENKGLGFARQMVVDKAESDYIIWVDGDMILSKDYVQKMVKFMDENPRVGIATGRHEVYPRAGLIAALEDICYVAVDYKYNGEVSSRLPGTAGSIYRVRAIREAGGFDAHLKGVGEDLEAAQRVREAGWLVYRGIEAVFYERRPKTCKALWDHYLWYGYGAYSVIRKNKRVIKLYKMLPISGFIAGVWYSTIAYKLKHQKWVFLLPFHYAFKRIAWCLGYIKAYLNSRKT